MARIIVGVLRGGTSGEYDLSLKSGSALLSALPEDAYATRDIFVDKKGMWYSRGVAVSAPRALAQVDVVINALHGGVGEDGTVQRILERAGVPYTGSRSFASALSLQKIRGREVLQKAGVRIPRGISFSLSNADLTTADMARATFEQFGPPYIVKAPAGGASVGMRYAADLRSLPDAIGDVLDIFGAALVEEYIRGQEASVGIMENYRGEELYALPPAKAVLPDGYRHIGYEQHTGGELKYLVPSPLSDSEKRALMDAARAAHRALDMKHFSRADLIITPRAVYLLDVNSTPGLYSGASMPQMLETVGSSVKDFAEHAIQLSKN